MTHRWTAKIARPSACAGIRAATIACTVALAAAACTASGASPSPTPEPTAAIASPAIATPGASVAPSSAAPSTPASRTATAWGEIWDAVPAAFPVPAGASAADLPDGPFSGTFTTAAPVAATASAIADGLRVGGYLTVNAGSPAEDGSVTIDATGAAAGCRVQVTVKPLGGLTAIEVLYGSGCPAP
jgi:hypothetical protein